MIDYKNSFYLHTVHCTYIRYMNTEIMTGFEQLRKKIQLILFEVNGLKRHLVKMPESSILAVSLNEVEVADFGSSFN